MATIAQLIGGAGTGKTTRLLEIMAKTIEAGGLEPTDLGFVSFTRAARAEASSRAAEQFGVSKKELEQTGWFRTLHSVCYRALGAGKELLAGGKADNAWIQNALQEGVERPGAALGEEDDAQPFTAQTEAGAALAMWDAARNRLEGLSAIHSRAEPINPRIPDYEFCRRIVEQYETAKRIDHRLDFVDLVARFAGFHFTVDGPSRVDPEGDVPALPVWFFDEQQDTSALLDSVCHRLIEKARWVYVVGDPFQAIYGWAGADPKLFQSWPVAKRDVMPKSYRCPREILDLGEAFLSECSDYWPRGIRSADHEGEASVALFSKSLAEELEIDPRQSWLLLARSNAHARRLAAMLDGQCIPWVPTRGAGGWNAPSRNAGLTCLYHLETGSPIDGGQWTQALKLLPASFLERGTKAHFGEGYEPAERWPFVFLKDLPELGGTENLQQIIASGKWRGLVDRADAFACAVDRYGLEAATNPGIKVGTVHSVKGAEADNVLWLTTTSEPVAKARETQEGLDEEQRVAYVASTRARKRLIIAREKCRFCQPVPLEV